MTSPSSPHASWQREAASRPRRSAPSRRVERTDVYGLYLACCGDDVLAERDDRGEALTVLFASRSTPDPARVIASCTHES
jgi:hypothetical protein